jgi:hypothetical protein
VSLGLGMSLAAAVILRAQSRGDGPEEGPWVGGVSGLSGRAGLWASGVGGQSELNMSGEVGVV